MVGPLKVVDVADIFDLALPFVVISYSWKIVGDLHPSNTPTIQESKNKIKFYLFLILFKTPQPPPLDDKQHVDPSNMCTKTTLCCTYIGYAVLMTFSNHSNLPQVFHIFWTSTHLSRHTHSCNIPNG